MASDPPVRTSQRLRLSLGLICLGAEALLGAADRPDTPARVRRAQYRMGTILEIDVVAPDRTTAEAATAEAFERVGETEQRLSNWRADSELSSANRGAFASPFPLTPATFWSLSRALSLARETGGAFDPTIGPVTKALGLTGDPPSLRSPPPPNQAWVLIKAVGWEKVALEEAGRTLRFLRPGMAIDSGAFGKGEALDRAVAILRRRGTVAARLNFGGQIALFGVATRQGRRLGFDRVAIAAPDNSGRIVCQWTCRDGSVSTSGDAERKGHILDPRTGLPAAFHGSVTVFADTALRADALSTALFVLGPREGLVFADARGIPAVFLFRSEKKWQVVASRAVRPGRLTKVKEAS